MQEKTVYCLHCGKELIVSIRAVSTGCPVCNHRLSVEDFTVTSLLSRTLIETCGSVAIAPSGMLRACLRVNNLFVEGSHQGNVTAADKVTLTAGASFAGDIIAHRLEVRDGALIKGFCRIDPQLELIPTPTPTPTPTGANAKRQTAK